MGVAERKERHREELKKEILKAARELFVERGYESTSIRNIAEKIEYSPATIYLYYKDKNEIIHALHQEGFKLLISHFGDLNSIVDPFERLTFMGRAYIRFALENPDVYELIFNKEEPMKYVEMCNDQWEEGDRAFELLTKNIIECQKIGYFEGANVQDTSLLIWSTMHGMCTLYITGHLGHAIDKKFGAADINLLLNNTFESFILMIKKLKK